MKKLSVITVTYNAVDLIEQTIKSVLSQPSDILEYIVIDGNSNDGTKEIINSYKDSLSFFLSEPDTGIYDAMNKAISLASGEWVLFLNAGDVFLDSMDLSKLDWKWPGEVEFLLFSFKIAGDPIVNSPILFPKFGMPTSHQAMFISSKIMKQDKFNLKYRVAADYEFFVKRFKLNNQAIYVEPEVLSEVLPGGYSKKNKELMIREYQKIVLEHLGCRKAFIYFMWSNSLAYKLIRLIIPSSIYKRLKGLFAQF